MKVLIVTTSYPAHEEDPSGHFVRAEARRFVQAGHEVQVVAPLDRSSSSATSDPWTVHHVGGSALFGWPGAVARLKTNPSRVIRVLPFFVAARRCIEAVGRVDRVIGHWIVPSGIPLLVDHPAALEVVAHGADVRLLCALPRPVRELLVARLLDRATRFRFVAGSSLQTLANRLSLQTSARLYDAAYVEPAAMDLPDVAARAVHLRAAMDAKVGGFVVAVGRLLELKRFDLAILGAARARVPIVIVGDGPLGSELETLARRVGVDARFMGLLSRAETLAWIGAARVLVHPSRAEGAPTVVREARALGVAVVATACGDVEEWARRDRGIVIAKPGPNELGIEIARVFGDRVGDVAKSVNEEIR